MFVLAWNLLPGFTLGVVGLLLLGAAIPAASIITVGLISGSVASRSTGVGVAGALFVVLFLLDQLSRVLIDILADRFGGRIQEKSERALIRTRLANSASTPIVLQAALDAVGSGPPLRHLVVSTVRYVLFRAQAVMPGLVLVFIEPLAGIPVLGAFVVLAATMEKDYTAEQSAAYSTDTESGRAVYIAGLAFGRRTAREVVIFRAADWVIDQFRDAAHGARPSTRIRLPLLSALFLAVTTMAFALLVLLKR